MSYSQSLQLAIEEGLVSEVDLELSEALANVHTINEIKGMLLQINDDRVRDDLKQTLEAIPALPDRNDRDNALQTLLEDTETLIWLQCRPREG